MRMETNYNVTIERIISLKASSTASQLWRRWWRTGGIMYHGPSIAGQTSSVPHPSINQQNLESEFPGQLRRDNILTPALDIYLSHQTTIDSINTFRNRFHCQYYYPSGRPHHQDARPIHRPAGPPTSTKPSPRPNSRSRREARKEISRQEYRTVAQGFPKSSMLPCRV